MVAQTILWVALPNGLVLRDGGLKAQLSVFASPRLEQADRLAPFDFLDWPARLQPGLAEFEIEFTNTRVRAEVRSRPDSGLWRALFSESTPVTSPASPPLSRVYSSYPAAPLHDVLKNAYQNVCANSPIDGASLQVLGAAFADLQDAFIGVSSAIDTPDRSDRERRIRLANELFRPGSVEPLKRRLDSLVDLATREAQQLATGSTDFVAVVPDTGGLANRFAQFTAFHQQARGNSPPPFRSASDTQLDFHQMLSALGDYYGLLRQLGLVIDLEFDPAAIPPSGAANAGLLRIAPRFIEPLSVTTTHRTPATAYNFDRPNRFQAALSPAGIASGEFVDGLLNLRMPSPAGDGSQFHIVQVDVDGAGFEAIDLLNRVIRTTNDAAPGRTDFGLAPLRSSGLSVVRSDNAHFLLKAIASARQKLDRVLGGEENVTLFAEDLIRGFRIDIHEKTSDRWHSLHQRVGKYTFPKGQREVTIAEENCIQPSIVQPTLDQSQPAASTHDPLAPSYISESLFLWQGWSLAVTRPGEPLPQQDRPRPAGGPSVVPVNIDLTTRFTVAPGSLPRLRFGEHYQVRARIADLAGNGPSIDDANAVAAKPVLPAPNQHFPFLRFEPVSSPLPVFRAPRQSGESVDRVVLRSSPKTTAEAFADQHPEFRDVGERHIAPPKTSQLMAEMFGLFDVSIGTGRDTLRTHQLATREKGSLADGAKPPPSVRDDPIHPEPSLSLTYLSDPLAAGVVFRNLPGTPDGFVLRARDAGLQAANLPPLSGVAKDIQSLTLVDFGSSSAWPDLLPFRLRLAEGTAAPIWNAAERVLTVFLAKGESRAVRMACHVSGDADLKFSGLWAWMVEWLKQQQELGVISETERAARFELFRQLSLLGLWWMLTPARELTLVHAVQQPLEAPALSSPPQPSKIPGATFAYLKGQAKVHAPTTGRLDLVARWTEKVDRPSLPRRDLVVKKHVFGIPLHGPEEIAASASTPDNDPLPPGRFDAATGTIDFISPDLEAMRDRMRTQAQELVGSTDDFVRAAGMVRPPNADLVKRAVATRSDAQLLLTTIGLPPWPNISAVARRIAASGQFDPDAAPDFGDVSEEVKAAGRDVENTANGVASAAEEVSKILQRFQARHEFGDTKHRIVRYQAVATTRFRTDFPVEDEDSGDSFSSKSAEMAVNVLSSSPPAAPKVCYVIPTFGLQIAPPPQPGVLVRKRIGGGLRVYLDRPWYSSGEGELLGVILSSATGSTADALRAVNFTQWGRDPIWKSGQPVASPAAASFRRGVRTQSGLVSLGAPPEITVVGHEVDFDDARQLYFSDIEIDESQSYFPFVRLALARYQPDSMEGVHLSRTVLTDFAQLAPHRTVTLTPAPDSPDRFTLKVEGLTYLSNSWKRGDAENGEVIFERPPTRPPRPITEFEINPGAPLIDVSVQQRIPGTNDAAGWLPADSDQAIRIQFTARIMAGFNVSPDTPLWLGQVALPGNRTRGQFRIVIREFEHILTGHKSVSAVRVPGDPFPDPDSPHPGPIPDGSRNVVSFDGAGRLVFADAIEL